MRPPLARQLSVSRKRTRRSAHIIFGDALLWPLMESLVREREREREGGRLNDEGKWRRDIDVYFRLRVNATGVAGTPRSGVGTRASELSALIELMEHVLCPTGHKLSHANPPLSWRPRLTPGFYLYLSLTVPLRAFYRGHYVPLWMESAFEYEIRIGAAPPAHTVDTSPLFESSMEWDPRREGDAGIDASWQWRPAWSTLSFFSSRSRFPVTVTLMADTSRKEVPMLELEE